MSAYATACMDAPKGAAIPKPNLSVMRTLVSPAIMNPTKFMIQIIETEESQTEPLTVLWFEALTDKIINLNAISANAGVNSKDITNIIVELKRWKKRSLTRIIPSGKKHDKEQNASVRKVLISLSENSKQVHLQHGNGHSLTWERHFLLLPLEHILAFMMRFL